MAVDDALLLGGDPPALPYSSQLEETADDGQAAAAAAAEASSSTKAACASTGVDPRLISEDERGRRRASINDDSVLEHPNSAHERRSTGCCRRCCCRCECIVRCINSCRRRNFVVVKAIAAVLLHLSIGMAAFMPFVDSWGCLEEGASSCTQSPVVDSLYFSVVTLTTVGYGDIVPTEPWAKAFVCGYIIFGLTGCMYALSSAADYLL